VKATVPRRSARPCAAVGYSTSLRSSLGSSPPITLKAHTSRSTSGRASPAPTVELSSKLAMRAAASAATKTSAMTVAAAVRRAAASPAATAAQHAVIAENITAARAYRRASAAATIFVKGHSMKNVAKLADRRRHPPIKPPARLEIARRYPPVLTLRITPYAWAKLLYLRDAGTTEIGGFGISAQGDLLLVEDVQLVRQDADWASVVFDDSAVADFYEEQVAGGRAPSEFGRVWIHTHPGNSPQPSGMDEETFARAFGNCNWSVMLIVARGGATYARIAFGVGPGGSWEIPLRVDFEEAFAAADFEGWREEYERCVSVRSDLPEADDFGPLDPGGGWQLHDTLSEEGGYAPIAR
jgi:hypothetical protein